MVEDPTGEEQKAQLLAGVRGFDLAEFELHGVTHGLPIVEVPILPLKSIWELGKRSETYKTVEFQQSEVRPPVDMTSDTLALSRYANPCNIAVAFNPEGNASVLQSDGRMWSERAKERISGATSGIVGGGGAVLQLYEGIYHSGSLQIFRPPIRAAGFNILLKTSGAALDSDHNLPAGLYFAYDKRHAKTWDSLIENVERDIRRANNLHDI